MNVHEEDIVEISRKLTKMTDGSKSMDDAVELVTAFENMRKTRIGTVLNDFRRKINDEKVAKRCKALIRKWEAEEEEEGLRHKLMKKRSDKEEAKERPSFVPSGALAKESGSNRRADEDRRERDRGRERREQHHHHHHEHRRKSGGRGGATAGRLGQTEMGGRRGQKGGEAEKQQQRTGRGRRRRKSRHLCPAGSWPRTPTRTRTF